MSGRKCAFMWSLMLLSVTHLWSQTTTLTQDQQVKIDALIDPLVNSNNYAGTVLIGNENQVLFTKSYGFQNQARGVKNSGQSKFFLASASMMFTATAMMKLVDEGKIALDDKLSKYRPDFKNGDKITIHHMLAQRSGIPAIGTGRNVSYGRMTMSAQTPEKLIGYFKDYDLLFEPGTKYGHERSEYILLAKIIEDVSGKTFGEYLKTEIFAPLNMNNSGHFSHDMNVEDVPNLSKGYQQKGLKDLALAQQIHWSSKTGHASVYSTAEDLFKFAQAALKKELLSAESWKKMLSDHGDSVGYGWFIRPQGTHERYQMNGRSPGFTSFFSIFPADDLVVIMLANTYISVPHFTAPKLASIMFGEPYEHLILSNQKVADAYGDLAAGIYQFGPDFYRSNGRVHISFMKGRLYSDGGPMIPIEEENGEIKRFIHRRYWSTLEFVKDEEGKVSHLKFDSYEGKKL